MNSEIARMLFYMAVHYGESGEIDLELNNQVSSCTNPYHGKLASCWNGTNRTQQILLNEKKSKLNHL